MHTIEPHHNWRNLYIATEDDRSPFYGKTYSEFEFTQNIYDHVIHPQWDYFGENVLNFHGSDDCYYEEWSDELNGGWIYMLNFREHVLNEFRSNGIDQYFTNLQTNYELHWRTFRPLALYQKIEQSISEADRTGILELES